MRAHHFVAPAALLLAACGATSGLQPVTELQSLQKLETQRQYAEIARQPVPDICGASQSGSGACPKIHAIRAHACLEMARQRAGPHSACPLPGTETRQYIDCAADGYRRAQGSVEGGVEGSIEGNRQGSAQDAATLGTLAGNAGQALYCSATFHAFDGDAPGAMSLAQEAQTAVAGAPDSAQNAYVAASAALLIASQQGLAPAERCAAAHAARTWSARGLAAPQSGSGLSDALRAAASQARAQAGQITGCGGM